MAFKLIFVEVDPWNGVSWALVQHLMAASYACIRKTLGLYQQVVGNKVVVTDGVRLFT